MPERAEGGIGVAPGGRRRRRAGPHRADAGGVDGGQGLRQLQEDVLQARLPRLRHPWHPGPGREHVQRRHHHDRQGTPEQEGVGKVGGAGPDPGDGRRRHAPRQHLQPPGARQRPVAPRGHREGRRGGGGPRLAGSGRLDRHPGQHHAAVPVGGSESRAGGRAPGPGPVGRAEGIRATMHRLCHHVRHASAQHEVWGHRGLRPQAGHVRARPPQGRVRDGIQTSTHPQAEPTGRSQQTHGSR